MSSNILIQPPVMATVTIQATQQNVEKVERVSVYMKWYGDILNDPCWVYYARLRGGAVIRADSHNENETDFASLKWELCAGEKIPKRMLVK